MSSGSHQNPTFRSKPHSDHCNQRTHQSGQNESFQEKRHKRSPNEVTKAGRLHPRNAHLGRYDFEQLEKVNPGLSPFVILNPRGEKTIDFSQPRAVLALNETLLKAYYGLDFWQIPQGYLCPPIPGRVDYIHYLADLLTDTLANLPELRVKDSEQKQSKRSTHRKPTILDIGSGANCIYPLLGCACYGWNFVGSDIDPVSVKTAQCLVEANPKVKGHIELRLQHNPAQIFKGIIKPKETFALSMCNPPFHASMEKATQGSLRKINHLNKAKGKSAPKESKPVLNFAGTEKELCYQGGEIAFLKQMALESQPFSDQVCWFTTLVSKQENVPLLQKELQKLGVEHIKVIPMSQGQKMTRVVAWTFLTQEEQALFFYSP